MSAYYRDVQWHDAATGLPLTEAELLGMRDAFLDTVTAELAALADELGESEPEQFITWPVISVNRWADRFLDKVREIAVRAYAGVTGGTLSGIPTAGWETIAGVLDRQAAHAAGFIADVRAGKLSKAQIAARSELYSSAATESWSRGQLAQQAPGLALPGMPGQEQCGGRCRCQWQIEETDTEWRCTWITSGSDNSCDGCLSNSRQWAPYVQTK